MLNLTDQQKEALIAICHESLNKAAKQLSLLLSHSISILAPNITLSAISDIGKINHFEEDHSFCYISQEIHSGFSGRALLIVQRNHSSLLTHSVLGKMPKMTPEEMHTCEQEALLEIGNIMISSYISAIANMTSENINLTAPNYAEGRIETLLKEEINKMQEPSTEALVLTTPLQTNDQQIISAQVLLLPKKSIEFLLEKIRAFIHGKNSHT